MPCWLERSEDNGQAVGARKSTVIQITIIYIHNGLKSISLLYMLYVKVAKAYCRTTAYLEIHSLFSSCTNSILPVIGYIEKTPKIQF